MQKEESTKADGRYIIYYKFNEDEPQDNHDSTNVDGRPEPESPERQE